MFRSKIARLFAFMFVLLSFSLLVSAAPAPVPADGDLVARGGTCTVGCHTGTEAYDILVKLKADLAIKFALLDGCYKSGTDPTSTIAGIAALITSAAGNIASLEKDLLGLLNGKLLLIVNLCVSIVITVATHCAKWSDKADYDAFLTLCVVIDVALKGLLSACGGLSGILLSSVARLLGGSNLALLLKVKFSECIGILAL
ncbi:hypothetical protein BDV93DRAFT_550231 [Ceratobasidium sp. AG-I]|nr:hypothetical protein BDV93DRAFT_550231 [Ceratobasidium sp. AG-I]